MKTPAQFIAENIRGQDFEVGRLALTGPIYGYNLAQPDRWKLAKLAHTRLAQWAKLAWPIYVNCERFFIFIFFKIVFNINIYSVL